MREIGGGQNNCRTRSYVGLKFESACDDPVKASRIPVMLKIDSLGENSDKMLRGCAITIVYNHHRTKCKEFVTHGTVFNNTPTFSADL